MYYARTVCTCKYIIIHFIFWLVDRYIYLGWDEAETNFGKPFEDYARPKVSPSHQIYKQSMRNPHHWRLIWASVIWIPLNECPWTPLAKIRWAYSWTNLWDSSGPFLLSFYFHVLASLFFSHGDVLRFDCIQNLFL